MSTDRPRFSLAHIASLVGGRVIGDPEREVVGVRPLRSAQAEHLAFIAHPKERVHHPDIEAGALLCSFDFAAENAHLLPCDIICVDPVQRSLIPVLDLFTSRKKRIPGVHSSALVDAEAHIDASAEVGAFALIKEAEIGASKIGAHAFIGDGVVVGDDCDIGPHAVILDHTRLGSRVTIQAGAVVGGAGFGFAPQGERNVFVPQVGTTEIGDDVFVGSNACIDRGALDYTRVGRGTKIDNLVQVGHGVVIGEDAVLVSQTGLAGGAVLGDRVVFAGQSGAAPYVHVGDDARVGGRCGVTRDMPARAAWSGMPGKPHQQWLKSSAHFTKIPQYSTRIRKLEEEISELRNEIASLAASRTHQGENND